MTESEDKKAEVSLGSTGRLTVKALSISSEDAPVSTAAVTSVGSPTRAVTHKQARYLAHSTLLEECGPPNMLKNVVWVISGLLSAAIIWAILTPIDEAARAAGEVVPRSSIQLVQHLEGGILRELSVREGQIVEKGQILARLEPADAMSDLDQLKARQAALSLTAERLRAFSEDRKPDFTKYAADFPDLVNDQMSAYSAQLQSRDTERRVLGDQLSGQQAQLKGLEGQRSTKMREQEITAQELTMARELAKKGLISKIVLLQRESQANQAAGAASELEDTILRMKQAVQEAKSKLADQDSQLKNNARNEINRVTGELAQLDQSILKAGGRVNRLQIVAPMRGIVKDLAVKTVGGVIAPGAPVMELVPIDEGLRVEAHVSPRDIGRMHSGAKAIVKISSFDYGRYGGVNAVVERVSPSTFAGKDGAPYYLATLRLEKNYLGDDPKTNLILPGMTVEADIRTGERSVMGYLLSPIYRTLGAAMSEH